MEDEIFDAIVVGGGVAGAVCAYKMAASGLEVVLIERGETPGSKNLSGGVFYCDVMSTVFPEFLEEAPLERVISRNCLMFLNDDSHVMIDYADRRLAGSSNAVTVLRAKLDQWLIDKCEEAGVMVMPGIRVDELIRDGDRIVGVKAGDDELRARVVVAADGVNSFCARSAGIRRAPTPDQLAVGVKSVIGLDPKVIEERFGVNEGEGAAYAVVGSCTRGLGGGGFVYTNTDSISIGVVIRLDELKAHSWASSSQIHDDFLAHPEIARLLEGGTLREYGCHLVAEGGHAMRGTLVADGLVVIGDAAGLTLNTGFTVRGMDLAAQSGICAAETLVEAAANDDFSAAGLAAYERRLDESFAGRDMITYAGAPDFLESPRMYGAYGQLAADLLFTIYRHDLTPRRHLVGQARAAWRKSPLRLRDVVSDVWKGVRAL